MSQPTKRSRNSAGKAVPKKSKLEIFVETCGDVLEEIWEGVMEALDRSDAPISKEDEKEDTFTKFILLLNDELLQKVQIVEDSDEESEAEEESEEEKSLTDQEDTEVSGEYSVYSDSEQEEPVSEDEEELEECSCADGCSECMEDDEEEEEDDE